MPRCFFNVMCVVGLLSQVSGAAQTATEMESGRFTIHLLLHAVGEERYIIRSSDAGLTLSATSEYSDRGSTRSTTATLLMKRDYTPLKIEIEGLTNAVASVEAGAAMVQERGNRRTIALQEHYFAIFGSSPFAVQMTMMRYWKNHGRPASLPLIRESPSAAPVLIEPAAHDVITVSGKAISLDRYTVANLIFGREILWMNSQGKLAAAMTFAGGLPMEAVRTEYETALEQLFRIGVAQQMANLATLGRQVQPERAGTFAIIGATLVAGTDAPPVKDSIVIVRDGRIAAVGSRGRVVIPRGVAVVSAQGQTLLPGLWEMHTHMSGVEFGPALLAAGITTARDLGGEFDFLVALRDTLNKANGVGPRLLLGGVVDAGGAKAFGHITADTPDEGRVVVNRYHAAGFEQIKLYTFLAPDVVRAITAEAHSLGMTVTGHVPASLTTFQAIEAGMDQINHLSFVSSMMRSPGAAADASVDVNSESGRKAVQFLKAHQTVVDPTAEWGAEMSSHPKDMDVGSFEPGIAKAPFVLDDKFQGRTADITDEQMRLRMADALNLIRALHGAGVPIVPGTDTGLVGYGLHRELELYVEAGMTPFEAIQSATVVSARAMGLEYDSGSVEVGKRADLVLVDANPLTDIHNIRKVSRVVVNGRLYSSAKLWRSVGFQP